jgi:uncharacterized membrane protein YbhN (UPF0104 family)
VTAWLVETLERLSALALPELLAALACYGASLAFRAEAWRNVIAAAVDEPVGRRRVFAAFFAGGGLNAVLPARTGVVARVLLARPAAPRASWVTLTSTLVAESVFNTLVGGALVAIGLVHLARSNASLPLDVAPPWLLALVAAGGLALAVTATTLARSRARGLAGDVRRALAVVTDVPAYLRSIVSWQAADWAARLATIYWVLRAAGLEARPATVGLVLVALSLASLIPLTPGGVGTKQAALLLVLAGTASSPSLAAFGVALGIAHALVDVGLGAAGLLYLAGSIEVRAVVRQARAAGGIRAPLPARGAATQPVAAAELEKR